MMHRLGLAPRPRFLPTLLLLLAIVLAPVARAAPSCSGGNLALNLGSVAVARSATVGTLLGSPTSGTASFSCSGLPSGYTRFGIQSYGMQASQLVPAQLPASTSTNISSLTFATNVAGIGVRLNFSPVMRGYDVSPGDQQSGAYIVGYINGNSSLGVNYTAQLVVTGTVSAGTINALTLLKYEWYIYGYNNSVALNTHLTLNSGTRVSLVSCSVDTDSTDLTVTLPTLSTRSLGGPGATAGRTPFKLNLSCQSGVNVSITMSTSNAATAQGVIAPTLGSSYAGNVGVQLLDGNFNAVVFGTAKSLGASPNGTLSIPFYAQYYQTGSTAGAGKVSGTATFTMSYQ